MDDVDDLGAILKRGAARLEHFLEVEQRDRSFTLLDFMVKGLRQRPEDISDSDVDAAYSVLRSMGYVIQLVELEGHLIHMWSKAQTQPINVQ